MARKNTAPDSDVENASVAGLSRIRGEQDTIKAGQYSGHEQKRITFGTKVFNKKMTGSSTSGRVRSLPIHKSLSTRESSSLTLARPVSPSCFNDRIALTKSTRATPARRVKTESKTYASRSPASTRSLDHSSDDDVWCDARSVGSSFSDTSDGPPHIDSSTVRWPSEKLGGVPSPRKSARGEVKVKSDLDLGLDLLVRGTKALHIQPSKLLSSRTRTPYDSDEENMPPTARPSTPPQPHTPPPKSPSKSRLNSPSKRAARIPTPPGRPSLDAFWDAEHINAWNELYSPTKPLLSPRKDPTMAPDTPSRKAPVSPRKSRASLARHRDFESSKMAMAETFLAELDKTVCAGAVARATEATGGVRIVWSKTLLRTAGRAYWKRLGAGPAGTARIELASKVLTSEERLRCTLAHEFCHLATYVVDGMGKKPHGKEFNAWGRKVEKSFPDVEITTRHSYAIEMKYVWACVGCSQEYGRHSRSIDPTKSRCGRCKGTLVQIKPAPRANGGTGGFAGFVKENFKSTRDALAVGGMVVKHADVMEELGRRWKAAKAAQVSDGEESEVSSQSVGLPELIIIDD